MTTTRAARYLAAATLAVLLAACSAATGDVSEPTAEPAPVATEVPAPTPEPTLEPTPEIVEAGAGDTITEEEAELLPEGQRAYPLEDATLVVVGANDPLPEVVREHAEGVFEAHIASGVISSGPYDDFERNTGKNLTVVAYVPTLASSNKWGIGGVQPPVATKAEAVAIAEAHIAAQDNPDNWALIVVD